MHSAKEIQEYAPSSTCLADRVILVTGAGNGIGRTLAKTLASFGAEVILLGRNESFLIQTYDEIEKAGFKKPAIYPLDLANATLADYQTLLQTLSKEFDALHGLIHNAAALGAHTPLVHYDWKQWYKIFQVNLHAPFLMTQALIPLLKKASHASVVFTIDSSGLKGEAYKGAYGVSKFGLQGLMETFAEEFEVNTHIRFNSIQPGPVATRMRRQGYPAENPAHLRQPEDIMSTYLYLMEDASIGVTKHTFFCQ